jgi:hypothetical protein
MRNALSIHKLYELSDAHITPSNKTILSSEIVDAIITSLSLRVYRFLPSDLDFTSDRTVGEIDIYAFTTFPIDTTLRTYL